MKEAVRAALAQHAEDTGEAAIQEAVRAVGGALATHAEDKHAAEVEENIRIAGDALVRHAEANKAEEDMKEAVRAALAQHAEDTGEAAIQEAVRAVGGALATHAEDKHAAEVEENARAVGDALVKHAEANKADQDMKAVSAALAQHAEATGEASIEDAVRAIGGALATHAEEQLATAEEPPPPLPPFVPKPTDDDDVYGKEAVPELPPRHFKEMQDEEEQSIVSEMSPTTQHFVRLTTQDMLGGSQAEATIIQSEASPTYLHISEREMLGQEMPAKPGTPQSVGTEASFEEQVARLQLPDVPGGGVEPGQQSEELEEDVFPPESRPVAVRPPAGSGLAAACQRRLINTGLIEQYEQQSAAIEAGVDRRPCTKLATVSSLPAISLDPNKVADETKRVLRLNYHRVISPPTVYQNYKRAAVDIDLQGEEVRLHTDPVLQERRFVRQRARDLRGQLFPVSSHNQSLMTPNWSPKLS
ncbi:mei2 [Symbiodinium sp. CCMP2456]|nr:mei2 [Symbiodinium sp. CCMP2456]